MSLHLQKTINQSLNGSMERGQDLSLALVRIKEGKGVDKNKLIEIGKSFKYSRKF